MGDFTVGAHYIVGTVSLNAGIQLSNPADVDIAVIEIKFNDEVVAIMQSGDSALDSTFFALNELLIPPYTHVVITVRSSVNDSNNLITATYVGRVYA